MVVAAVCKPAAVPRVGLSRRTAAAEPACRCRTAAWLRRRKDVVGKAAAGLALCFQCSLEAVEAAQMLANMRPANAAPPRRGSAGTSVTLQSHQTRRTAHRDNSL